MLAVKLIKNIIEIREICMVPTYLKRTSWEMVLAFVNASIDIMQIESRRLVKFSFMFSKVDLYGLLTKLKTQIKTDKPLMMATW